MESYYEEFKMSINNYIQGGRREGKARSGSKEGGGVGEKKNMKCFT